MPTRYLAIVLVLCGSLTVARASDEADIRARLHGWAEAFNGRDKQAACELFSTSLLSDVRGQGEADYATRCAAIGKALDDPTRTFSYAVDIREVIVEGDLAIARLTWTLSISPGGITSVEPGLDVFRKESDGRWRIVRFMAYEVD